VYWHEVPIRGNSCFKKGGDPSPASARDTLFMLFLLLLEAWTISSSLAKLGSLRVVSTGSTISENSDKLGILRRLGLSEIQHFGASDAIRKINF